jgi:membrane protease YdiL (CAAX protease family)
MGYLFISVILLFAIFALESRRNFIDKIFPDNIKFISVVKNNFNFWKILLVSLCFVSFSLLVIINMEQGGFLSFKRIEFEWSFLPYIFYSVFTVPIIEEYIYRFIPFSFKKFNNVLIYVIILLISSLIFTYFHNLDSFQSVFVFLIGVFFSVIFLKTKNICYSILCHSFYNLVMNVRLYMNFGNTFMFVIIFIISLILLIHLNNKSKTVEDEKNEKII